MVEVRIMTFHEAANLQFKKHGEPQACTLGVHPEGCPCSPLERLWDRRALVCCVD